MNEAQGKNIRIGVGNALRDCIQWRIGLVEHMLRYPKITPEAKARNEGEKASLEKVLEKVLEYMDEIVAAPEAK